MIISDRYRLTYSITPTQYNTSNEIRYRAWFGSPNIKALHQPIVEELIPRTENCRTSV